MKIRPAMSVPRCMVRVVFVAALALAAGCASGPAEPGPVAGRAPPPLSSSRGREDAERERPARIKRDLLAKYGAELTPLQRSALLGAPIASREEGEALCRRWIEENRRFEKGR